jgi:hypothetical protein
LPLRAEGQGDRKTAKAKSLRARQAKRRKSLGARQDKRFGRLIGTISFITEITCVTIPNIGEIQDTAHFRAWLVPAADAKVKTVCLVAQRAPDLHVIASKQDVDTLTCQVPPWRS